MKKTLLLLASMAFSSMSVFAQWAKPVPSFVPMADDGETEQYLYNVEAGGFFMAGNDWQTRASINYKEGAKVKIAQAYEDDEKTVPLGTWSIWNYVPKFSEFRKAFCDNPQSIWTDNNSGANCDAWVITALGENKYEITNPTGGIGKLGMAKLWEGVENTRLWLLDPTNEELLDAEENLKYEGPCTTWAFVSVEEYDALSGKIAAYNSALKLKELIDSEDSKNVPDAVAAAQAYYDNTNSSAAELDSLYGVLKQAIADYNAGLATPENPSNLTGMIVNPNFDGIKFDGWAGSGWGAGGTTDECAERYDMAFDTYQDIAGLSKGVYKVLVNGFFRGDVANTPVLYAKSGETEMTAAIANQLDGAADDAVDGVGVQLSNGKWGPNSMKEFVAYENAGYYNDMFVYVPVGEGGDLRIGVKKANKGGGTEWVIVDTWRLMYYGNSVEAYKLWFSDTKTAVQARMEAVLTDETLYDKTQMAAYEAAVKMGDAASTPEEIMAAVTELNKAADAAIASIEAYNKYVAKLTEVREYMTEHDDIAGADVDILADYIMEDVVEPDDAYPNGNGTYIIENCLLTTEQITAEIDFLDVLFQNAVKNGMSEGSDVSFMLKNPKFDGNFDGWTTNGAGKLGTHNVEVYQAVVDCYQVVEGIPNGLYELTCQAFERPAGNGSYTGDEEPKVFLFMNNFQTPVQNIVKDALPAENAVDKENCYLDPASGDATGAWPYDYNVEGYGYVPNSIDGAYYAFNAGRYKQSVYGLVTDGKMKIGLTSNGVSPEWVLWANFTLTFMGQNKDAMSSVITDLSATLSAYIEEHQDNMSAPAVEAANAAIAAAEAASDADAMWEALIAVNEQITAAKANVAAVEAFNAASDAMNAAADSYYETATDEAKAAYDDLAGADYTDLATADIEAMTVKMNEVAGKLRIPAYDTASDDAPVDFTQIIVNSSFDTDATGWSGDGAAHNTTVMNAEFYNKNFNFYQEFYGLPAGTYSLKVQGYYRQGSAEADYKAYTGETEAAANAKLFANNDSIGLVQPSSEAVESKEAIDGWAKCGAGTDGDVYIPNTMTTGGEIFNNGEGTYWNELIFKFDGNGALRIGLAKNVTISTDWTLFDTFQLWYYGANSTKEPNSTAIEGVANNAVAASAIYNAAGQRVKSMTKGINIIKMSDGSVRKILVK